MIFKPFLAAVATLIEDFPAVRAVAYPRAAFAAARDPWPGAARLELSKASIRDGLVALCAARNNCDGATGHDGAPGGGGDGPDVPGVGPRRCVDCAKAHWTERRRRVLPRPDGLLAPEDFPAAARNFVRERRPDGVTGAAGVIAPDRFEAARRCRELMPKPASAGTPVT
jgi:hypothetical protein